MLLLLLPGPKYYLLNYTYVPDILEKRGPFREAHLGAAQQQQAAGKLIAGGAVGDPVEGAVFFFKDITKVRGDPGRCAEVSSEHK